MKKTSLRVASLLLALVLMTSCFVGGTFARYITKDEGSDSARVAKFGVVASITGSLFAENYYSKNDGDNMVAVSTTGSVDTSVTGENIVAPGTKNDKGMTLSITGTPEVAVDQWVSFPSTSDIWLKIGDYGVMVPAEGVTEDNMTDYYVRDDATHVYTKVAEDAVFTDGTYYKLKDSATANETEMYGRSGSYYDYERYYPIVYTVKHTYNGTTYTNYHCGISEPNDNGVEYNIYYDNGNQFDAGKTLENSPICGVFNITWEWPFHEDDDNLSACDTILGDLIAQTEGSSYEVVSIANDGIITGTEVKTSASGYKYAVRYGTDYVIASLTAAIEMIVCVEQID